MAATKSKRMFQQLRIEGYCSNVWSCTPNIVLIYIDPSYNPECMVTYDNQKGELYIPVAVYLSEFPDKLCSFPEVILKHCTKSFTTCSLLVTLIFITDVPTATDSETSASYWVKVNCGLSTPTSYTMTWIVKFVDSLGEAKEFSAITVKL